MKTAVTVWCLLGFQICRAKQYVLVPNRWNESYELKTTIDDVCLPGLEPLNLCCNSVVVTVLYFKTKPCKYALESLVDDMFMCQKIQAQQNCTSKMRNSNFLIETSDASAVKHTSRIFKHYSGSILILISVTWRNRNHQDHVAVYLYGSFQHDPLFKAIHYRSR